MNIIIIAGDPGGGRALIPVIKELLRDSEIQLFIYGYNEFLSVYHEAAIPHTITELPSVPTTALAAAILTRHKAERLLAANSMNEINWEGYFFDACQQLKVASLSVLDFWGNYQHRYDLTRPDSLPHRIAVPDKKAQDDMLKLGFPEGRIRVSGQPALEMIAQQTLPDQASARRQLKDGAKGKIWIGFVSQPLSELYGSDTSATDHPGYTEHNCLADLHQYAEESGTACELFIRPHPREKLEKFKPYRTQNQFTIDTGSDKLQWIAAMDIIIGMNSIFLFEAALCNADCISYQPHMEDRDCLPSNHSGLTHAAYRSHHFKLLLQQKIEQISDNTQDVTHRRQIDSPYSGSTQNIITTLINNSWKQK